MVELALVAPILILLAMTAWDGGSALREQVVLQQAARDGARVAATAYGPNVPSTTVANAVLASARDLTGLASTPGYLSISYPDPQSVQVQLRYAHSLITPVLRQVWGGGSGTLTLHASAIFYLPQLTPVPATLVAPTPTLTPTPNATPTLTPTPTPTITPTPSITPTATPTPQRGGPCAVTLATQQVQSLSPNTGFWCTLQLTTPSFIVAYWQDNADPANQLLVYPNIPAQFGGVEPASAPVPPGNIAVDTRAGGLLWAGTPCQPIGTYTVLFFNGSASRFGPAPGWAWPLACGSGGLSEPPESG
jgi:hypothetical protein